MTATDIPVSEPIAKTHTNSHLRTLITQRAISIGIVATFFLIPVWHRVEFASDPFLRDYSTGYLIFIPIIWTISWWIISGFKGVKDISKHKARWLWLGGLLALAIWGLASQRWSFMATDRPEIAAGAAAQFALAVLFVAALYASQHSISSILMTLAATLLLHALIGGAQVAQQGSISLDWIGEFSLDPQREGIGVIQVGETRWLRPYGLTAHPNIFAGFVVIGLLASLALSLDERKSLRWAGTSVYLGGFWVLLLTFSRSAWLGFGVACLALLILTVPFIWKNRTQRRQTIFIVGCTVLLSVLFFALYRPLILVRAGVNTNTEITETRSLNERAIYNNVATEAIRDYPLLGVGIGNFPWYASHYLFYETDTDMRGDNVHNIYLAVQAELGILGTALWLIVISGGLIISLRSPVDETNFQLRSIVVCSVLALLTIGLFDHYMWTMLHFQILLLGLIALSQSKHPNR